MLLLLAVARPARHSAAGRLLAALLAALDGPTADILARSSVRSAGLLSALDAAATVTSLLSRVRSLAVVRHINFFI